MNYHYMNRNELIDELQKLQKEYDSLKAFSEKKIEDCRRTEEALHDSEERFRLILENSGEAFLLTNPDGSIYSANPEACRIFCMSEEEICKLGRNGLVDLGDPRLVNALNERNKTGKFRGELRFLRKDGKGFPAEVTSTVFQDASGNTKSTMIIRDITERKQAEELLTKNEARLKVALSSVNMAVFNQDKDLRYTWMFNPQIGYTTDEVIGKTDIELLPAEAAIKVNEIKRMAIEKGEAANREIEVIIEDNVSYFNLVVEPLYNRGGQIVGITGASLNITERKKTEELLKTETENFRRSLDDSPLGVRIATANRVIIYANKALLDFYGYESLAELQATPLKMRCTKESYNLVLKNEDHLEKRYDGITNYDISIIRKDGEIRHLRAFLKEIIWTGIKHFQVIYEDITSQKQVETSLKESEAKFRSIFENSFMGISIARPGGNLLQVNHAYARMYGYENPGLMLSEVGETNKLFANPEDRKEVLSELKRKGVMEPREFELIRRDGSHLFVMVSAGEIRDSEGTLLFNQATHIDLTGQKKLEEDLRNSKEFLEKLNLRQTEVREEERANISREIHDQLGQSLTALKLDLNRMHIYIKDNPEAVLKLERLVDLVSKTIKDVQRISSELRPGILDELGLISTFEWYCDEFSNRTGIKSKLKLDNSEYPDPKINLIFFRVLQETLTNVIRHAKASSVSVKLRKSTKGTTMTIRDNGIGIPAEMVGSSRSLGLISMRERVKQFNGTIDIISDNGNGTKLIIFIPYK